MKVPVQELASTEDYLAVLDGHPPKFAPGERFAYSNSGYVVLALIAERASGVAFADLVRDRVCEPAGMGDTAFLRSDELPAGRRPGTCASRARGGRTPSTFRFGEVAMAGSTRRSRMSMRLWDALFDGRIVAAGSVAEMLRPRSDVPSAGARYGLGFWLHASTDVVSLEGCDAGVSFRSVHDPRSGVTHTVLSNTADGAWSVSRFLDERLGL